MLSKPRFSDGHLRGLPRRRQTSDGQTISLTIPDLPSRPEPEDPGPAARAAALKTEGNCEETPRRRLRERCDSSQARCQSTGHGEGQQVQADSDP